jgi:hypothetical protein
VKVCGLVASVSEPGRYRSPAFLNFEEPSPRAPFSVVIWPEARPSFGGLRRWKGQRVCVTGKVSWYRERAQMRGNESATGMNSRRWNWLELSAFSEGCNSKKMRLFITKWD